MLTDMPPPPPAYVAPAPLLPPKLAEFKASLGAPMIKAVTTPTVTLLPSGFVLTNIALSSGQVTLAWQQGQPLFQVQGQSDLGMPWGAIGNPTTARTKTFPAGSNHYWRVQGSLTMPLTVNTNQPRLTWGVPDLDMSDSLTTFTVQRATDSVNFTSLTPTVPAGGPYQFTDTTPVPSPSGFQYKVLETTANGVVVPYNVGTINTAAAGNVNWLKTITGLPTDSLSGADGNGIAISANGNICQVGSWVSTPPGTMDFGNGVPRSTRAGQVTGYVICRNSSGAFQWMKSFGSSVDPGNVTIVASVAADSAGHWIIFGKFYGTIDVSDGQNTPLGTLTNTGHNSTSNMFLAKYNADGTLVWAFALPGNFSDVAIRVVVDSSDNIIICGEQQSATITYPDGGSGKTTTWAAPGYTAMCFAKFNSAGLCQWAQLHSSTSDIVPGNMCLDPSGNIYIIGRYNGTFDLGGGGRPGNGLTDGFTVKYLGSDGSWVWDHTYFTSKGANFFGSGIAVNPITGAVVAAGEFTSANSSDPINFGGGAPNLQGKSIGVSNFYFVSYDSSGNYLWQVRFGADDSNTSDYPTALAFDSSGRMYVVGYFGSYMDFNNDGSEDAPGGNYFVAAFTINNGPVFLWAQRNRNTGAKATGLAVAVSPTTVVSTGWWFGQFQAGSLPAVISSGGSQLATHGGAPTVQYSR